MSLDLVARNISADNVWQKALLPIRLSALGFRQFQDQYHTDNLGPRLESGDSVTKFTGRFVRIERRTDISE